MLLRSIEYEDIVTPKIATCSYCGTRAALVLDKGRHELTCASCGAPLHEMKAMPKRKAGAARPDPERPVMRPRPRAFDRQNDYKYRKKKKKFRRESWGERLWDVAEDLFDEIFD